MTATDTHSSVRRTSNGFFAAVTCALFAGLMYALISQLDQQQQRPWQEPQLDVVVAGQHYRLGPPQQQWLQQLTQLHFSSLEADSQQLLEEEVTQQLARVFDGAAERLPEFADWYYSLSGDYTRLAATVMGWLGREGADQLARQAAERLFPEGSWDVDLAQAQQNVAASLLAHQQQRRIEWLATLSQNLSPYRVPAPLAQGSSEQVVWDLDRFVDQRLLQEQSELLQLRSSLSSAAALGMAGSALLRAAAARTAANAGRGAATARVAGRGAARAGSAALGGGAVCAPAGPVALGCAAVAGVATWIASDWLLLKLDEIRNRDELLAALQSALDELEVATRQEILQQSAAALATLQEATEADIRKEFIPMQRLQHSGK